MSMAEYCWYTGEKCKAENEQWSIWAMCECQKTSLAETITFWTWRAEKTDHENQDLRRILVDFQRVESSTLSSLPILRTGPWLGKCKTLKLGIERSRCTWNVWKAIFPCLPKMSLFSFYWIVLPLPKDEFCFSKQVHLPRFEAWSKFRPATHWLKEKLGL